jgi:hypothetical protein
MDITEQISQIMASVAYKTIDSSVASTMIKTLMDQQKDKKIYYTVSEKGAISVYGIRKIPITLYKEELFTIFDLFITEGYSKKDSFLEFIEENEGKLSVK